MLPTWEALVGGGELEGCEGLEGLVRFRRWEMTHSSELPLAPSSLGKGFSDFYTACLAERFLTQRLEVSTLIHSSI